MGAFDGKAEIVPEESLALTSESDKTKAGWHRWRPHAHLPWSKKSKIAKRKPMIVKPVKPIKLIKPRIVGGACKPCKKGTFRGEFDELLQDGACPPCRPMKKLKPIKRKIMKLKPIKHRIVGGACKPCRKGTFRGEFNELLQDGACPPCRPMKKLKPIKRKIMKLKPIKHRIVGGACKPCRKG